MNNGPYAGLVTGNMVRFLQDFTKNISMINREQTGNAAGQSNYTGDQASAEQYSQPNDNATGSNTVKDPDDWTTGDEPMTGAQRSYLTTLSQEAGEPLDENLTKAEASKKIDELQHKTGRGLNTHQ